MTKTSITFNSISEIPGWLRSHPQVTSGDESTSCASGRSWDLNTNLDKALDIAERGGNWEKGGALIKSTTLTMDGLKSEGRIPSLDTDVAGFLPDIEAFLAGDPSHMWGEGDDEKAPAPVISIGVGVRAPSSATSQEKINFGAAVLSVIDELEDRGARVELWAVYANKGGDAKTDFRVLLKSAEDSWSPNSVAFALCHPAYHRRLMFRLVESFTELEDFTNTYGTGYQVRGFDMWIPAISTGNSWTESPESALKHITKLAQRQLNQEERTA